MNISFPRFDLAKGRTRCLLFAVFLLLFFAIVAIAQRTAREFDPKRMATPDWAPDPRFKRDTFTFLRIKYSVDGKYGLGHTLERWAIDFPDSDLNFSYRLQQVTSIKANPDGYVLEIADKELFDYPFIYIVEPGRLTFQEKEIPILRKYLLNGGFLMFDDFWGEREWKNFYEQIQKILPGRQFIDLDLKHPVFHTVFDLKEKPQVPGLPHVIGRDGAVRPDWDGRTWERPDAKEVHYRAILDDKERIMVMICHNTD